MSLTKKLVEIQTTLSAPKNQRNAFGNYNYRSCEDILNALKPLLESTGCSVTLSDEIVEVGGRVYIKSVATLSGDGDPISATAYAREPENKKGMDCSQITGAASSYARKYALNGLFAIDDSKDADTQKPPAEAPPKRTQPIPQDVLAKHRGNFAGAPSQVASIAKMIANGFTHKTREPLTDAEIALKDLPAELNTAWGEKLSVFYEAVSKELS